MAFDSSGILAAKAPDILPMIQGVQAYKNALAANPGIQAESAQAQADLAAKTSYGNALINPDGTINPTAGAQSARANPAAAAGLGQIGSLAIAQRQGNAQASSAEAGADVDNTKALLTHATGLATAASAVLKQVDPATGQPKQLDTDDVTSAVGQFIKNDKNLPQNLKNQFTNDATDFAAQIGPPIDPNNPNAPALKAQRDTMIRNKLQQIVIQGNLATDAVNRLYGSPGTVNNGAAQVGVTQDPFTGAIKNSGTGVVNQVTPGQKMERVQTVDPITGATTSVPQASLSDAFGNPKAGAGALPTSISPQAQALQSVSAQRAHAISDAASGAPGRIAAMQSVRSLVNGAPSTAFGPTSDLTSTAQKIASAFGINTPELTKGQVSVEGMNKLFASIAAQQGVATGAGTDASRALIHDANPSLANSKAGMLENLAIVQGNEQYGIAKNRALQQYLSKNPSGNVQSFESTFNNSVSPLAFQFQNLDPAGRQRLFNSLTGKEVGVDPVTKEPIYNGDKGRLQSSWAQANKRGWFEGQ